MQGGFSCRVFQGVNGGVKGGFGYILGGLLFETGIIGGSFSVIWIFFKK